MTTMLMTSTMLTITLSTRHGHAQRTLLPPSPHPFLLSLPQHAAISSDTEVTLKASNTDAMDSVDGNDVMNNLSFSDVTSNIDPSDDTVSNFDLTDVMSNVSADWLNVTGRIGMGGGGQLRQGTLMLMLYVHPAICFFGIVGNSLSFVVFLSKKMRRVSTNIYLAALSASSGLYLLCVAVVWTDLLGWKLMHKPGLCQATVYLTYCSDFFSVWLVVCIAVENFVINFFLRKASQHCTVRRAVVAVVLLSVSGFLLYDFAIWTTVVMSVNGSRSRYCTTHPHYQALVDVFALVDAGVTLVVPSLVNLSLLIPTCFKNLSPRARLRPAHHPAVMLSRRERALLRVTRLLCVIIASHVLLTLPSHAAKLIGRLRPSGGGTAGPADMIVVFIAQTLYHLSYSMNFVYYLVWGKNFRRRFRSLFLAVRRLLSRCHCKLLSIR